MQGGLLVVGCRASWCMDREFEDHAVEDHLAGERVICFDLSHCNVRCFCVCIALVARTKWMIRL